MEFIYDIRLSPQQNAKIHYEKAKKLKGKIPGMEKAIAETEKKKESEVFEDTTPKIEKRREKRWYEAFRWFISSDDLLVIGGRDATSNEVLIKKHLSQNDKVFHANISGAPFFIIKEGDESLEKTLKEAAEAAAAYSKAWSRGLGSVDVYNISPSQVSKTPPSGEYLPKGAFMIYGEKKWDKNITLKVAVGEYEDSVIGGPVSAIASKTKKYVVIEPGDMGQGTLAKKIREKLGVGNIDEIQRFLPAGGGKIAVKN
jgi:predicted ribosome quality control (RQC) complex YloA/Tae2 family protein